MHCYWYLKQKREDQRQQPEAKLIAKTNTLIDRMAKYIEI